MTAQQRCFVISPIGSQDSPTRRHADNVFKYIIKPAADDCGIEAKRSDQLHEPGRISEQMFREIIASNCCVCVLTGRNPNVYYELAIAQAVGTPVIILIEKEEELPFDIQDLRCVRYDFEPDSLFEGKYTKEVAAHLRSLEAASWRASPLISDADLLRRRPGFPQFLIEELSRPFEERRESLSSGQKRILFKIESLCHAKGLATQLEIAREFGKAHDDPEMYYRLEYLRLLGFIENHRDADGHFFVYRLSSAYGNSPPESRTPSGSPERVSPAER